MSPWHHGNLREVLLNEAEAMLHEVGADGLSLRELARRAGVSHGAPRSHFADRQALLDALAEAGFARLTSEVQEAAARGGFEERFRAVGQAYVRFAVADAELMELMFAAKTAGTSGSVSVAAARLFEALGAMMAALPAWVDAGADRRHRFGLLFAATMQGAAALVATGRVTVEEGRSLVDDATDLLLRAGL